MTDISTDSVQVTEEQTENKEPQIVLGTQKKELKKGEYLRTIGRRKTSTAQVRLFTSTDEKTSVTVNGKELSDYFTTSALQKTVLQPVHKTKYPESFTISVVVKGGGISSQAEAVRHGISRALVEFDLDTRPILKKAGFLKRDSRSVERKKFGLKKARKSSQWSKR